MGLASATALITSLIPMSVKAKAKAAMVASMIGVSYFTSFFEVFEEKSRNGWRWRKAVEGELQDDVTKQLTEDIFDKDAGDLSDMYDYAYDPEIDEYPPRPKYVDEMDGSGDPTLAAGGGDIDEPEAQKDYTAWKEWRKILAVLPWRTLLLRLPGSAARRECTSTSSPNGSIAPTSETFSRPTSGAANLFASSRTIRSSRASRAPWASEDKRPFWFELFGTGVWEEKTTASRRLAREFGAYRKSMHKMDEKVQLRPCDGADKGGPGAKDF